MVLDKLFFTLLQRLVVSRVVGGFVVVMVLILSTGLLLLGLLLLTRERLKQTDWPPLSTELGLVVAVVVVVVVVEVVEIPVFDGGSSSCGALSLEECNVNEDGLPSDAFFTCTCTSIGGFCCDAPAPWINCCCCC